MSVSVNSEVNENAVPPPATATSMRLWMFLVSSLIF